MQNNKSGWESFDIAAAAPSASPFRLPFIFLNLGQGLIFLQPVVRDGEVESLVAKVVRVTTVIEEVKCSPENGLPKTRRCVCVCDCFRLFVFFGGGAFRAILRIAGRAVFSMLSITLFSRLVTSPRIADGIIWMDGGIGGGGGAERGFPRENGGP